MKDKLIDNPFAVSAMRFFGVGGPTRKDSGFSLLEVLISIVILSFGLLGMVGMQASALKSNREARLQSSAVVLARELAEMMRGNKDIGVKTSAANNPYLGSFSSPLTATTPTYCLSVGATACANTVATADAEMTEWLTRVDTQLPGARVVVCFDTTPFDAGGLPQWTCTNSGDEIVVKIGWTRASTNLSNTNLTTTGTNQALERATIPSVVFPVTPGSAT